MKSDSAGWQYHLSVGALRVSMLLAQAERIIGLSGSAEGNTFGEVLGLETVQAKYFELPSSRDPETFGTRRVDHEDMLDGKPGIYLCSKKILALTAEQEYVDLVVKDVCEARQPREIEGSNGQVVTRPVLIFVNPDRQDLVDKLTEVLRNKIEGHQLRTKFTPQALEGDSLQQMGSPGSVTLVSLLCGRGVDIRVSSNIPDSMHVVLATNIISSRMLTQIIGRTGRMGQDGSYSIITLGETIGTSHQRVDRATQNMLHHMVKDFLERLKQGCTPDQARKWLMRASEHQYVGHKNTAGE